MKRWSSYSHHNETLTVGELRELLAQFPDDAPVVVGYEGVENSIKAECLSVVSAADCEAGLFYSIPGCVMIDAEHG